MYARCILVLATIVPVAALCGCRSDPYMDAYLDTVNAEKVALQDTIYELQFQNEQLKEQLEAATSATSGATSDSQEFGPLVVPPDDGLNITPPGSGADPNVQPPVNPDLTDPKTEPGMEVDPKEIFPDRISTVGPVGQEFGGNDSVAESDEDVTHLHINRVATRGRNTDGQGGDDVLVVGLEPRDRYGRFVATANPVSIVVLDPLIQGAAARVAEWHFDAREVAIASRHAGEGPMILLEGSWPKRPPQHSRLQLWARYTTSDGRILQTSETIQVSVEGQFSTRWTPRQRSAGSRVAAQPRGDGNPEWRPNR